jgi:hypothetical protein
MDKDVLAKDGASDTWSDIEKLPQGSGAFLPCGKSEAIDIDLDCIETSAFYKMIMLSVELGLSKSIVRPARIELELEPCAY